MKNLNANDWRCAYIYCRASTDVQTKHSTSIDQHEADARKLCANRAITIVEVFTDRDTPAATAIGLNSIECSCWRAGKPTWWTWS